MSKQFLVQKIIRYNIFSTKFMFFFIFENISILKIDKFLISIFFMLKLENINDSVYNTVL